MGPMDTVTEVEVQHLHHMVTRRQEFGQICSALIVCSSRSSRSAILRLFVHFKLV